jgi:quinoprotein glucose dehydrogenase
LAVLLTLRRLESPEVAGFLNDAEPRLVVEAARAINDMPINAVMPQLAALVHRLTKLAGPPEWTEALWYRVLNANFRLDQPANAAALATVAARPDVSDAVRIEALQELEEWAKPSGRDRLVGLWRPLEPRSGKVAADAMKSALGGIFSGSSKVRQEGARVAGKLGIQEVGPALLELVADRKQPAAVRTETLKALETLHDTRLAEAVKLALNDGDARLRAEGRRVLAKLQPAEALPQLEAALERGERIERQGAFAALGDMKTATADRVLVRWMEKLLAGKVPADLQLDLLEAARGRPGKDIQDRLARFEAARPKSDHLAAYREALVGGNAENGRWVFLAKAEVSCLRCHKINGEGGEVGPDLSHIGSREKREYILESIVDPNRQIAKGFETVVLETKAGRVHVGVLKSEDDNQVRLMTAEGVLVTVPKADIEERQRGKSAMPEDLIKALSKRELRDLVEFLANAK